MIIDGFSIDGFGIFRDVTIRELPPNMALFVGDNEAGKSTTLSFVLTVLFGYPDGRSREKAYPALNGGQPGGRLFLNSATDGTLTVERRDGAKGGPVTVVYGDGRRDGAAATNQLLGGTTRRLYRNLYAFSLTELQEIETLTDEEVRDVLYGASLGVGVRSLPDARKQLENRLADLFRPRANNPQINQLLKQLKDVRGELREAKQGLQQHEELSQTITKLNDEITELNRSRRSAQEKHERVGSYIRLWDDWITYLEADKQVSDQSLIVESFPGQGLVRLQSLNDSIKTEHREFDRENNVLDRKREEKDSLAVDELLLECGGEISSIVQGLETYEQAFRDIPAKQQRKDSLMRQIQETLSELGTEWTQERAAKLDRSAHVREEIETHKKALDEAVEKRRRAEQAVHSDTRALEEANAQKGERQTQVEKLSDYGLDLDRQTLVPLRNRYEQFRKVLSDIPLRTSEHTEAQKALSIALREIDPSWTIDTLEQFDCSLTARQQVSSIEQRLLNGEARVGEASAELKRIKQDLKQRKKQYEDLGCELQGLADGEVDVQQLQARKSSLRHLRSKIRERDLAEKSVEMQREIHAGLQRGQRSPATANTGHMVGWAAWAAVGIGFFFGGGLWLAERQSESIIAGVTFTLVAFGLWMLSRQLRSGQSQDMPETGSVEQAEQRLKTLEKQAEQSNHDIAGLCSELGVNDEIDDATLERLLDNVDDQLDTGAECQRLVKQDVKLRKEYDARLGEYKAICASLESQQSDWERAKKGWQERLESMQLDLATSPRSAGFVFAKAETARAAAQRIQDLDQRLSEMAQTKADYLSLMNKVPRLDPVTQLGDQELSDRLDDFFKEVSRREEKERELQVARSALKEAEKPAATAAKRLEDATKSADEAHVSENEAGDAWKRWLVNHGLDEGWSPEIAGRGLDRASRLAELVVDCEEVDQTISRLGAEQGAFNQKVTSLFAAIRRETPEPEQYGAILRNLEGDLIANRQQKAVQGRLETEIPDLDEGCKSRREHIQSLRSQVQDLLRDAGADDEEEFRACADAFSLRKSLIEEIAANTSAMKKISGETDFEGLTTRLKTESLDKLKAESRLLDDAIQHDRERLDELLTTQGQFQERLREISSADTVSRKRAEEEQLLQQLRDKAADWSRYAVAQHLLSTAKERFEESHQPEVIKKAGHFFSTITGGKYERLFASHGEADVEVVDCDGRHLHVDDLSRGTAEQLYLAIRFGYISTHRVGGEALPILMDDVLVNFDPTRAANAAKGILEMAKTHQVLFFTCHPETQEIFRAEDPQVPVYRIAGGTIQLES